MKVVNLRSFSLLLIVIGVLGGVGMLFHQQLCPEVAAFCAPTEATQEGSLADVQQYAPRYWQYSSAAVRDAQLKGKVVLYFWAPWCSTCTSLDDDLLKQKQIVPEGVTILRIDYDHATALKQKYHIVTQHTFVQIDQQGQPISTWVGGEIAEFKTHLQ